MTDESKLYAKSAAGQAAQRDLDSLKPHFERLEAEYTRAWRETAPNDTEQRERLWVAIHISGVVRKHLQNLVSGGKIADREIAEIKALENIRGAA